MISYKDRFLFIHVPRTGGTSIENFLQRHTAALDELPRDEALVEDLLRYQHLHAARAEKIFLEKKISFGGFFKFSFVRNPWEALVSFFFYDQYTLLNESPGASHTVVFADYVRENIPPKESFSSTPKKSDVLFGLMGELSMGVKCHRFSPSFWLCDDDDNMLMDFVGRFENLQQDFDLICDRIKIPRGGLSRLRACGDTDSCPWHKERGIHIPPYGLYTEYYNDESLQLANDLFQKDADYFGYKFGE